jgi:histidinol-phosphate aminotransferase
MHKIIEGFHGIVVIDEAYIDFSDEPSWLNDLDKYQNLIVLHTFSKAWGLASLRCGMAFASEEIIAFFNKVKYPYNLSTIVQQTVIEQLNSNKLKTGWVNQILEERKPLIAALKTLSFVEKVYPSDANFLLVKVTDANGIYKDLVDKGVIVRNRNSVSLCGNCLRITVGNKEENSFLINSLKNVKIEEAVL